MPGVVGIEVALSLLLVGVLGEFDALPQAVTSSVGYVLGSDQSLDFG